MNNREMLSALISATLSITFAAPYRSSNPRELGDVAWRRDLDQALVAARDSARPVLILFDEVPGCSTCVSYGESVLRHPLIVEAAETLFVAVAIYNNLGGKDAEALKSFGEPAWNNPVVRIVDSDRRPLAERVHGEYTPAGLLTAMTDALSARGQHAPEYLRILAEETRSERNGTERAVFAMGCFWSGEACFGAIEGVVRTRTGFMKGREAVEVEFDPRRLAPRALLGEAKSRMCASHVFAKSAEEERTHGEVFGSNVSLSDRPMRRSEKDDKYNLASTPWRHVPMTELQATRANAAVARGEDPSRMFSPRQRRIFEAASQSPNAGWADGFRGGDLRDLFARAEAHAR